MDKNGSGSAFEFTPANNYAVAMRIDNYSVPGLRMGLSAITAIASIILFRQTKANTKIPKEL